MLPRFTPSFLSQPLLHCEVLVFVTDVDSQNRGTARIFSNMNRYIFLFFVQIFIPSVVLCEDQVEAVRQAELDRNYRHCLSGSSLCNKQLLTANQTEDARKAELDRNYRHCLSGSSLCNKTLLGGNQGDQIKNSENKTPKNEQETFISQEREKLAEDRRKLEEEKRQQEQQFITERERQRQQLAEERKRLEEEKRQREQQRQSQRINLQVAHTQPAADGITTITVQTNADTASLLINGEEQGGKVDGNYTIKRVARVGQDTQFKITAVDVFGNSDTKIITVARQYAPAADTFISLKPEVIKKAPARDAVAIIIGIQNYKRVPNAEFANNDAREFSEYAIRALGIKPEKIKLLLDDEADEVNIVKAFENWLPIQVNKDKTDVYVFYSGHGLPSSDGKSLYFLPHGVDKELLSRTAVSQNEIVAALAAAKPKSVTMFIDACYSGQTRGGDVLLASAKPVALKSEANAFPANFTVITASANDQISSSSPELKHGIFSFYLMKGMEGEADANQDGKITVGEMQDYLSDKVSRQAMTLNRKQNTQFVGDSSRVLVIR